MIPARPGDQAALPVFRLLLLVQVVAAGFFGLFPLLGADLFASVFGYSGKDVIIYRLAGASTLGYAVAAAFALWRGSSWSELRIPIVATLTFNVAAVAGSIVSLVHGDPVVLPAVVVVAAGTFAVLAFYWLRRDEGPPASATLQLGRTALVIVGLATLSAAVFGILPLVVPGVFANIFGLFGTDTYVFRLAGAATLGYATAGVLELRAAALEPIRIQNLAAITFNAAGAVVAAIALIGGYGGLLAPVVLIAAGFFTVTLALIQMRALR